MLLEAQDLVDPTGLLPPPDLVSDLCDDELLMEAHLPVNHPGFTGCVVIRRDQEGDCL